MVDYELKVYVNRVEKGEVANRLSGCVFFGSEKLDFRAIAYGRYGGQNVSPSFGSKAMRRLRELGVDVEAFKLLLQRKLVEGDFTIEEKPLKVKKLRARLMMKG